MASIAIIGTGISGLGAASLLHPQHQVTVYEKSSDIGGHTRTRTVRYGERDIAVDTGFIVFNYQNYPLLSALFRHLGVAVEKSNMTFGVTTPGDALEWGAQNANSLFGQRRNLFRPAFLRLLIDILRFNRSAYKTAHAQPELTLGGLIKKLGMSDWFARYYILPMGGAIWSCSLEAMLGFPALAFVDFFQAHGLLTVMHQPQWYTVTGGSQEYVKRLIKPFAQHIRTNSAVASVTRQGGKVRVVDIHGDTQIYDHVVLASHADESLAMLGDASPEERALLGAFKYAPNRTILHKDSSIMPRRRRCWSSWIYHASDVKNDSISVTYWMNQLQSIDNAYPLFVTLNPLREIAKEHVFDDHVFTHPIYSREAVAAQKEMHAIQGKNNTWFAGAYLRNGFHEDGLASAVVLAESFGVRVPWR